MPVRCSAASGAGQRGEALVGEHDVLAMHGDRFLQAGEQTDQRALALADHQILHRHLLEQTVGALGELGRGSADTDALGEFSGANDPLQLSGGTGQGRAPALPPEDETQQQQDRDGERNGQRPQQGTHIETLFTSIP